jgi:ABC-2 type transport system ATP-binding protein
MIRLENVTKLYGKVIGVNDLALSVESGAYGLVGPNGSGKSTLLNLITGQLRPTLGSLRVLGMRPWNNTKLLKCLGVCPEQDLLYPNVTGFEWVRYHLELRGWRRQAAADRARDILEQVGIGEAMHRQMGEYSRGMRQRTKLAQAIGHAPELLILDEPFNGLDPIGRHQMMVLLKDWIRKGRGLLLASHILHEIESITEFFLLICSGRLLASGTVGEVHSLLADAPNEIRVRCDGASQLACRLLENNVVDSVQLIDEGKSLVLSTKSPAAIYMQLPQWIAGTGIRIHELRCANDSLQNLFTSLLQIHRGEV